MLWAQMPINSHLVWSEKIALIGSEIVKTRVMILLDKGKRDEHPT